MSAEASTTVPDRDPREITFPYDFRLSKPVQAHGEDHLVLTLREPTGADVLEFGLLEGFEPAQFVPLVGRLAKVPDGTIKSMAARDLLSLATVLSRFFQWAALPPA